MRALAKYDFAGGHVITAARDPQRPTPVEAWEVVFGFDFERYILIEGYTGSGNMWVWRKIFDAVGGFRAGVAEDMERPDFVLATSLGQSSATLRGRTGQSSSGVGGGYWPSIIC